MYFAHELIFRSALISNASSSFDNPVQFQHFPAGFDRYREEYDFATDSVLFESEHSDNFAIAIEYRSAAVARTGCIHRELIGLSFELIMITFGPFTTPPLMFEIIPSRTVGSGMAAL